MDMKSGHLPREVAPSVFWMGHCVGGVLAGAPIHLHVSVFLIKGARQFLLVDTGIPTKEGWLEVERQLDELLAGRPLDWLFVTHLELPHAGNLARLVQKYPSMRILSDPRDFHLYYPEFVSLLTPVYDGLLVKLGGGYEVEFFDALVKDLVSSAWAFERKTRVMFVADGFSYAHNGTPNGQDEPTHLDGECALVSSELPYSPKIEFAERLNQAALFWTRFRSSDEIMNSVRRLIDQKKPYLIAPAHGCVIDNLDSIEPVLREAYRRPYQGNITASETEK
ncbi:MBL fold metallo-hydrolase [Bradyrhizobium cenepequi]|uniref:MBL fold metallo-hydrolase n=1 Tax=Bradyrhizobium cenepequi TaxID=2821403 RepID=UPI001CE2FC85|nr:MBL fold metallo-hydrolase [Bradyrhizobium cenepequi]MCA6112200.1 MBL fold metallo-hydrolase [Bradyrhizobium cenepequi]